MSTLKAGATSLAILAVYGAVLVAILVLLYGVAINSPVPDETAKQLNALSRQAEIQAGAE